MSYILHACTHAQCISPIPKYILHVAKLANQVTRTDLSIFNECSEPAPRSTKLYPKSRLTTLGLAKLGELYLENDIILPTILCSLETWLLCLSSDKSKLKISEKNQQLKVSFYLYFSVIKWRQMSSTLYIFIYGKGVIKSFILLGNTIV